MKKILIITLTILCLTACGVEYLSSVPTDTPTVTSTPAVTSTSTPTETLVPTQTISPTSTHFSEERFPILKTLLEHQCYLPCHLGIIPGETDAETACEIFQSMEPYFGACTDDRFEFKLGDYQTFYNVTGDIQNGVITTYTFEIFTSSEDIIYKFFPNMLVPNIFVELGMPDVILIDTSDVFDYAGVYSIRILYTAESIHYDFYSSSYEEDKVCLQPKDLSDRNITILLHGGIGSLGNEPPDPYLTTEPPGYFYGPVVWQTVEDILGISEAEFYTQLIENPDTCFEIISKQ